MTGRTATAAGDGLARATVLVPYIHGATLGRPSRGRPEKVLAHLKRLATVSPEDRLADGHDGRMTARGSLPFANRNGFPEGGGYAYRGNGRSLPEHEAAKVLGVATCPDCGQPRPDHLRTCSKAPAILAPARAPEADPIPAAPELSQAAAAVPPAAAKVDPGPAATRGISAARPQQPARRHRKCGYPVGSIGCMNTCGGRA